MGSLRRWCHPKRVTVGMRFAGPSPRKARKGRLKVTVDRNARGARFSVLRVGRRCACCVSGACNKGEGAGLVNEPASLCVLIFCEAKNVTQS